MNFIEYIKKLEKITFGQIQQKIKQRKYNRKIPLPKIKDQNKNDNLDIIKPYYNCNRKYPKVGCKCQYHHFKRNLTNRRVKSQEDINQIYTNKWVYKHNIKNQYKSGEISTQPFTSVETLTPIYQIQQQNLKNQKYQKKQYLQKIKKQIQKEKLLTNYSNQQFQQKIQNIYQNLFRNIYIAKSIQKQSRNISILQKNNNQSKILIKQLCKNLHQKNQNIISQNKQNINKNNNLTTFNQNIKKVPQNNKQKILKNQKKHKKIKSTIKQQKIYENQKIKKQIQIQSNRQISKNKIILNPSVSTYQIQKNQQQNLEQFLLKIINYDHQKIDNIIKLEYNKFQQYFQYVKKFIIKNSQNEVNIQYCHQYIQKFYQKLQNSLNNEAELKKIIIQNVQKIIIQLQQNFKKDKNRKSSLLTIRENIAKKNSLKIAKMLKQAEEEDRKRDYEDNLQNQYFGTNKIISKINLQQNINQKDIIKQRNYYNQHQINQEINHQELQQIYQNQNNFQSKLSNKKKNHRIKQQYQIINSHSKKFIKQQIITQQIKSNNITTTFKKRRLSTFQRANDKKDSCQESIQIMKRYLEKNKNIIQDTKKFLQNSQLKYLIIRQIDSILTRKRKLRFLRKLIQQDYQQQQKRNYYQKIIKYITIYQKHTRLNINRKNKQKNFLSEIQQNQSQQYLKQIINSIKNDKLLKFSALDSLQIQQDSQQNNVCISIKIPYQISKGKFIQHLNKQEYQQYYLKNKQKYLQNINNFQILGQKGLDQQLIINNQVAIKI